MSQMSPTMRSLTRRLNDLLFEIESCFKSGAKVTLIVRNPCVDDGDVVMGNDDYDLAIGAINKMRNRTPIVEAGDEVQP